MYKARGRLMTKWLEPNALDELGGNQGAHWVHLLTHCSATIRAKYPACSHYNFVWHVARRYDASPSRLSADERNRLPSTRWTRV